TSHLRHDELKRLPWRWQANLAYGAGDLLIKGALRAESGLVLNHELSRAPNKPLRLDWQAADIFLRAGNPLPATFLRWPELLELSRGRLMVQGVVANSTVPGESADLEVVARLQDIAGLYDRSIAEGVTGRLTIRKS